LIIQALTEFYERISSNPDYNVAPLGFEKKELQFLIVIDKNGKFVALEDTREKVGKKLIAKQFLVPRSLGRSGSKSYETTFLLWDHVGYLFGEPSTDPKSKKQHETWIKSLKNLPQELKEDEGVSAIIKFYEQNEDKKMTSINEFNECLKAVQCNMSFRLVNDIPVPCRPAVIKFNEENASNKNEEDSDKSSVEKNQDIIGICLISGEKGIIARTHGRTPINKDTKSLISFQKNSGYDSYGKEQAYNAPITQPIEFKYVTALNSLLKNQNQKKQIANTTVIFWSEKETDLENEIGALFDVPDRDDPGNNTYRIRSLFNSLQTGAYIKDDNNSRFYILGLSPNSARISIRLWSTGPIGKYAENISQYFNEFEIVKPPKEQEFYSIWSVLDNISTQVKSDKIPPNLSGDFIKSTLEGSPYPSTLFQAVLRRIKSDTKYRVKPIRGALIKAYLNRYYRFYPNQKVKEITVKLDIDQPSIGYQLGRLFAILEKIQETANPGLNTTIRERYYGAACATPVSVYPILLKLKNHHLAKLDQKGRVIYFEKLLGEVLGKLNDFPGNLDLHEQGRFAIGYYHQRQSFFVSKEAVSSSIDNKQN
jgi:CRISPR-associated protein Csd1